MKKVIVMFRCVQCFADTQTHRHTHNMITIRFRLPFSARVKTKPQILRPDNIITNNKQYLILIYLFSYLWYPQDLDFVVVETHQY